MNILAMKSLENMLRFRGLVWYLAFWEDWSH